MLRITRTFWLPLTLVVCFYRKLLFPQHREEKNSSGKAIYIHKICSNNFLSYSQLALIHFDTVTASVEELPQILTSRL